MLTLQLSEDQAAALEMAKRLAREVLRPAAGQASTDRCVPAAVWRTLRDSGLVVPIDAAYGGGGFPDACLLGLSVEALAYGDPAIATVAAWYGNAALVVGASGSAEQQQSYLTRLATGTGARSRWHFTKVTDGCRRSTRLSSSTVAMERSGSPARRRSCP